MKTRPRIKSVLCSALLLLVLLFSLPAQQNWRAAGQNTWLREPFLLELPDLGNQQITAPEAAIPKIELHKLRLRIRKPFADAINYGRIYTRVNGEAAVTIQSSGRDSQDQIVVTLDLDKFPRFKLQPGKNVIEVQAVDRSNKTYYASYVLLPGAQPATDAAAATLETAPVDTGADREPPTILLTEPAGPIWLTSTTSALTVMARGVVADESGKVAAVTVNGQPARLTPVSQERNLVQVSVAQTAPNALEFEARVTLGANAPSLVITAQDAAGNLARLSIPAQQRQPMVSSQFKGRKYAVVIGVAQYKYHDGGLNDLAYPDDDARVLRDFLQSREGGKFSPPDILLLENEQATIEMVRGALASFLMQAGPDDLVLFFIAGHGAPDPYDPQNLYYLLHDTRVADMPRTALPMTELQQRLDALRTKRLLVFVDTCHSAGLSGEKITETRSLENNLVNLYSAKLFRETGRAVLTSSDVNEVSRESKRWGGGHGVFTWALVEGLRGKADASGDSLITAGELFSYVRQRVQLETGFKQNPRALPGINAGLTLALVSSAK
jgi:hypothetical protein